MIVPLAGCADGDDVDAPDEGAVQSEGEGEDEGEDEASGTETGTASAETDGDVTGTKTTTEDGELDLREANVTDVEVESGDRGYRFSVTLIHDDDGEDGYANWWQVETLDGERLGRRDLAHPHGTREFTRSGTVEVPEGLACVVVRGHDETHEYGGQAALVDVVAGATRTVRQGPEPEAFEEEDCPP